MAERKRILPLQRSCGVRIRSPKIGKLACQAEDEVSSHSEYPFLYCTFDEGVIFFCGVEKVDLSTRQTPFNARIYCNAKHRKDTLIFRVSFV